ncbi:11187_t:CDS:2, partial [Racocetra fulgida]
IAGAVIDTIHVMIVMTVMYQEIIHIEVDVPHIEITVLVVEAAKDLLEIIIQDITKIIILQNIEETIVPLNIKEVTILQNIGEIIILQKIEEQENQNDQTYVQLLARQICNLTHQLEALQAGRSGFTQTITPISTDGVEIQDTDRQPTSVPTPIRTSPRMSELNLPSSHINEPKKLSSRFCSDEHLKPMDPIFKQVFRDEVVSILDQLPRSHQFKITKHFSQQLDHITCFTVPAIKEKISPALLFTDNELIAVLKQLHKSRRGVWKNDRRDLVDESRKRKHPPTLHWNEYLRDLEYAVNDTSLQSGEESDTDEELADNERENDERPENILDTNRTNLIRKRWHDDNYVDYKSRPKKDIPFWWISTRWSSNIEYSDNEEVEKSSNRKNKGRDNYMKNAEIMQLD